VAAEPSSAQRSSGRRGTAWTSEISETGISGSAATFGVGLLAPVSTLGPRVGDQLSRTRWQPGRRLVTTEGRPVRAEDIGAGAVSTVWPEGHINDEFSATLVMRLDVQPEEPTNLEWVVDDRVLAYSKVCTHAGCPVALYRERDEALFCPCHQSTFNVVRGATPIFGPAARALPQLPLGQDEDGYLVALEDFQAQVGPAYG
jgi:ubiquinol-cytochrome c reductase iron-sulfur subunit